jgi:hypothetical protein
MWYKVLTSGLKSAHGGAFDWTEYVGSGKRTPRVDDVALCERGYHATTDPMRWPVVGMRVFEAVVDGPPVERNGDKGVWPTLGLGAEHPELVPDWWHDVEAFVAELPTIPWMQPQGAPDPSWWVFETRDAAWDAAGDAAGDAARVATRVAAGDAAWVAPLDAGMDAGMDAALWALVLVCQGLPLAQHHIDHARARMDVWRRGYGLLGDWDGALYVYRSIGD